MASADPIPSEAPSTSSRKRPHFFRPPEPREQGGEEAAVDRRKKKKKSANPKGAWVNLNLILSLQSKEYSLKNKIEIAFDYVSSIGDVNDRGPEVIQIPLLISFLIDWIQPCLMSSESSKRSSELFDPCLDYRCWATLKFCLRRTSAGISPNLLRAFSHLLQHTLLEFPNHSSCHREESDRMFKHAFECLSLLLLSNSRAFYNTGIEIWISCSVEVVNLVLKVLTNDESGPFASEVLLSLSSLLLENFAGFLRFHPNPRNVFRAFVDRLLEPLLELLVLLQLRVDGGKCKGEEILLGLVKEVLSNGIFHPTHISGFLSLRNSNAQQEGRRLKGINDSYHRHLFQRLEKMIVDKKAVSLGGFGFLLCSLISRAKSQKVASMSVKLNDASGRHPETSDEAEGTSKQLFGVFTQFLEPLVLECKKCIEIDFSQDEELLELRLVEAHCMLKSVNEILASFIDEKVYVPTEDTSEEAHFKFLKEVYNVIISISGKIYKVWLSIFQMDSVRIKRILCSIAKEVFVAVGNFLEIEYKVVGNELVEVWLMILSYMTVQMPLAATKPCSLLLSEILKLSCRLINIYSELRQVDSPIFALCKAVRSFTVQSDTDSVGNSIFVASLALLPEMCLQSMATLLGSGTFQLSISSSIRSIPERQTNGCIQLLKTDVSDSLEWMKDSSLREGISWGEKSILGNSMLDKGLQAEILGRILSEIYRIILEALTVAATNSVIVGNSVEDLMKTIRQSFGYFVQNPSDGFGDLMYSINGRSFSIDELSEYQNRSQNFQSSIPWIFVFFFHMYSSCRSLYRQSICLMPPTPAKQASDIMGNLFYVSSGMEWRSNLRSLDYGYFSWIVKPSVSLLDIIHYLSEVFLSSSSAFYAPLVYVLNVMTLQRINDLNRMLKACAFLQEEDSHLSQVSHANPDIHKSNKRLKQLIATSRTEARELTKFLSGNLPLLVSNGKCICSQDFKTCEVTTTWDMGVCSLDVNSLPSQIWLLLSQNIDVWWIHASSKDLKMFLSHLLLYSLPCQSGVKEPTLDETLLKKVNMHQIASELINDSFLYEQPVLSKNLTSRFCHALKKSFTFLANYDNGNCKNLYSLSEWSEVLNILVERPVSDTDGRHALPAALLAVHNGISSDTSRTVPSRSPFHMQLKLCEDFLYLLCRMPGVHVTSTSFSDYATYILNLERLVMSNIQKNYCDYSTSDHHELLRLFISCRRAMKHLLVAFVDNVETLRSSELFIVFNHSTILWLLKSAIILVGLLHANFGDKYFDQIGTVNFSLVDHTAYIFLTLSKVLMNYLFQTEAYDEKLQKYDNSENDAYSLVEQHYETHENIQVWKLLDMLAEIFTNQIAALTDVLQDIKWETDDLSILNWNKLSCVVSCLQGFLWGMSSISDNIDHVTENQQLLTFINSCLSRLGKQMIVFEKFVSSCISTLIVKDKEGSEIHPVHKPHNSSLRNLAMVSSSKCHFHEEQYSVGNNPMPNKQGLSDDEHIMDSTIKKRKQSTDYRKSVVNAFRALYDVDLTNLQHMRESCLQGLLDGESHQSGFMVGQLFLSSAAILKLKCMLLLPNHLESHSEFHCSTSKSMVVLLETSHMILQGLIEMVDRPNSFTFACIDGTLKYLEVVGSYISLTDPKRSNDMYFHLIDIHLKCIGKCISLQGKSATLSSHEMASCTKMLQGETHVSVCQKQPLYARERDVNELKNKLRLSFRKFIGRPRELHLRTAVQTIQRALIGMQQDFHLAYEVTTGNAEGGKVSPVVAGGIDCLDLVLEYVEEQKQIIKESISNFVVCLFNIVLHLQHPKVFYTEKILDCKTMVNPDAGSVILMCIEVLTTIAGKHSFQMDACHASQCVHVPMVLFKEFHHLRDSPEEGSLQDLCNHMVDRQFSVDLYSSCCKLLYTTLKHRIREVEQCVSLLQQSVIILLNCLETVGANSLSRKGYFTWDLQEGVKCASFLRRIYEEIRQQKDALEKYSIYFLSTYISVYSGFGPFKSGIKREIDEALRPGIYSLIDICNANDIQQLHTVLDESACRSTLATLLHDYQLNFQFEGKV